MGPISENKASKWCRRTELVGNKWTKTVQAVDLAVLLLLLLLMIGIVVWF
jgi:hypothetical protein